MKVFQGALLLLLCISFFNCNNSEKDRFNDDAEFNYELEVIDQIFEQLAEEMQFSYGFPIAPPPPRPFKDENGKISGYDSTVYLQQIKKYQKDTADFEIEERSVLLSISDTMHCIPNDEIPNKIQLPSTDYLSVINNIRTDQKPNRKIPISKIQNTGYFYLQYSSEFNNEDHDLTKFYANIYNNGGYGMIRFSRIYFNNDKNLGLFAVGYYKASLNAFGGFILIRKIGGNWQIEKSIFNWIS